MLVLIILFLFCLFTIGNSLLENANNWINQHQTSDVKISCSTDYATATCESSGNLHRLTKLSGLLSIKPAGKRENSVSFPIYLWQMIYSRHFLSVQRPSSRGHHPNHTQGLRHHVGLRCTASRRRFHCLQAQEPAQSQVSFIYAHGDPDRSHVVHFPAKKQWAADGRPGCTGASDLYRTKPSRLDILLPP